MILYKTAFQVSTFYANLINFCIANVKSIGLILNSRVNYTAVKRNLSSVIGSAILQILASISGSIIFRKEM